MSKFNLVKYMWYRKVHPKLRKISGLPPLSFQSKRASTLKNYRIYGNTVDGESVGDLISDGEHTGEYLVPVTVKGKNLLWNTAASQTINGVTFTVNSDKSVTVNGTATDSARLMLGAVELSAGEQYTMTGCPSGGSNNTYRLDPRRTNGSVVVSFIDTGNGSTYIPEADIKLNIYIYIQSGNILDNLTFYPMIRKASITDDTYVYHAPINTNIYLPEPLKMVGDEAEYVDFEEQKQHFADGTSVDVMLPALPTIVNTNILSIDTQVPPSQVMVKGKIKAHPTGGENNG